MLLNLNSGDHSREGEIVPVTAFAVWNVTYGNQPTSSTNGFTEERLLTVIPIPTINLYAFPFCSVKCHENQRKG